MKRWALLALSAAVLIGTLPGCRSATGSAPPDLTRPIAASDLRIVQGQTVYVPAYSEVFAANVQRLSLAVTLTVHNTDPSTPIVIRSVRYYDANGELVRSFLDEPTEIGPLATAGYLVGDDEAPGGWGANFLVEWGAERDVYEPVIEAVMIGASFGYSVSLVSPGRVVSQHPSE